MSKIILNRAFTFKKSLEIGRKLALVRYASTETPKSAQTKSNIADKLSDKAKKEAESSSFAMNLFRGHLKLDEVFPYPFSLSEDDGLNLQALVEPTSKYFEEKNDQLKNDQLEKIPDEVMQGLKELGAFGLQVPAEYNGLGLNNTQYARIVEIFGTHDLGISTMLGGHQSIGFKGILLFGNDEQKARFLPRLASGEDIACFALTEPSSGSDAASIRSKAVPTSDGKNWILNGSKIWITNAGISDIFTVFAKTPITDEVTGKVQDKITAFIVEKKFPGVKIGPPEKKMGIKCSNTAEVFFEDVMVPDHNIIGGVGNGFKVAMAILNAGRFGTASALTGTMKYVIKKAIDHASTRTQFGKQLITFGTIQEKLARMTMLQYATEAIAYMLSANMDKGSPEFQIEAAISKVFGSEAAWAVTDDAIQILGGMGYMKECGLEKIMRDIRTYRIFEGTNDILRLFIASTGINYAGKYLKELQKKVHNLDIGTILNESKKRIENKIGYHNVPSLSEHVPVELAESALIASKSVVDLGVTVEKILIHYGKGIKDEQFVVNRISQSVIDIYAMFAVLSRASKAINNKFPSSEHEANLASLFCYEASLRIEQNLKQVVEPHFINSTKLMVKISNDLAKNGNIISRHPLGC